MPSPNSLCRFGINPLRRNITQTNDPMMSPVRSNTAGCLHSGDVRTPGEVHRRTITRAQRTWQTAEGRLRGRRGEAEAKLVRKKLEKLPPAQVVEWLVRIKRLPKSTLSIAYAHEPAPAASSQSVLLFVVPKASWARGKGRGTKVVGQVAEKFLSATREARLIERSAEGRPIQIDRRYPG